MFQRTWKPLLLQTAGQAGEMSIVEASHFFDRCEVTAKGMGRKSGTVGKVKGNIL